MRCHTHCILDRQKQKLFVKSNATRNEDAFQIQINFTNHANINGNNNHNNERVFSLSDKLNDCVKLHIHYSFRSKSINMKLDRW